MGRLGISIYFNQKLEDNIAYINKAGALGYKRIFTCLISGTENSSYIEEIKEITKTAKKNNMEVIADVTPNIFKLINASHQNLKPFKELGIDGIRLDEGFGGQKEAFMTINNFNFKIELNACDNTSYVNTILDYQANKNNLYACFNFYPQKGTAISYKYFEECAKKYKNLGLTTAAFVTSQQKDAKGPWPLKEGLPTLETHRYLPIDFQARHLYAINLIDDIIISNSFATTKELISLLNLKEGTVQFKPIINSDLIEVEKEILYDHHHFVRGDMSEYSIRSTFPRITYEDVSIPPKNTSSLKKGDIVILNDLYNRYKGELHIILQDQENEGNKNLIGKINDYEHILLDYLVSWKVFSFIK